MSINVELKVVITDGEWDRDEDLEVARALAAAGLSAYVKIEHVDEQVEFYPSEFRYFVRPPGAAVHIVTYANNGKEV
jgi:hypothetical protein